MELSSILFLLGFLLLTAAFVGWPFLQTVYSRSSDDHARSSLLAERERLLTALSELDFDHSLGKIPAEDYQPERDNLVRLGAEVMRKLDQIPKVATYERNQETDLRTPLSDEDVEEMVAKRRSGRNEKTGGFCPKCGNPVLFSDRFCPKCGKELK